MKQTEPSLLPSDWMMPMMMILSSGSLVPVSRVWAVAHIDMILDWLFVLQEEKGNDTREQTVCLKLLVYPTFLSKAAKTRVSPRPVPWSPVFPVPTSVNKLPAPVSPNNIANPSQKLEGKIIFDGYNILMDIVKCCHLIIKALDCKRKTLMIIYPFIRS